MALLIAGFICALVLAAIVIAWIAYCMFLKERPRSENLQYNISDIQRRNYLLSQEEEAVEKKGKAGIIFIPGRHQTDDYEKRIDYPESPAPITYSTYRLLDDMDTGVETTAHYKDGIYEVDSGAIVSTAHHSDV